MDYGRFKFERSKTKPPRPNTKTKEVKCRPKTSQHDLSTKVKQIRSFIEAGHKVRIVVMFRGREIVHPDIGMNALKTILTAVADVACPESQPRLENKNLFVTIRGET